MESASNGTSADFRWHLLALVIALSILIRVLFLGKSLWLDEGIAIANASQGGLSLAVWSQWFADLWSRSEFNMVFYFAALRVWMRAGSSEAFIRLLSVIPAVSTLPLVWAIGKRLFSERVAFGATLLLAVHGAHVAYSQEARGYTMVVFFCAAATYFFIRANESTGWGFWFLYASAATLGTYCHLFALLVVASHGLSLFAMPRRKPKWAAWLASCFGIFLMVLPALYFALTNSGHQVEWIPRLGPTQVLNSVTELAGSPLALLPYLFLWWFGVAYCRRAWKNPDQGQRWHLVLVLGWTVVPLLMATVISIRKPMLVPRYFLISAPASVLLAGLGAYDMQKRLRQITLWSAVLLSLGFVAFRYTRPKENWRDTTAYVLSHAELGDGVVVVPAWSHPVFDFYRTRSSASAPRDIPASALGDRGSFTREASSYPRVWVVVYTRDYALNEPDTRMVLSAMNGAFRMLRQTEFRTLQVRLYARTMSLPPAP